MMQKKNHDIYCNCCGKKIMTDNYQEREDYLDLVKEWGYFSRNKDGQVHHFILCESCYDKLTGSFVLPVSVTEQTELL